MTEAIGESVGSGESYDFIVEEPLFREEKKEKTSEYLKTARVFNELFKSTVSFQDAERGPKDFLNEIQYAMGDERLGALVYAVLMKQGLGQYEKRLGAGAFGYVFQIEGTGKFEGKKLALKLMPQLPEWGFLFPSTFLDFSESFFDSWSIYDTLFIHAWYLNRVTQEGVIGDGVALGFPKEGALSCAYGVLLFDGEAVQYVESIDPEIHEGHSIIGVVSLAVQGGTLAERVEKLPLDAEAVKGFGRSLAQAVHELHETGYTHGDIHMNNILLDEEKPHPYSLKLIDFGLARKISKQGLHLDWEYFVDVMESLYVFSKARATPRTYRYLDPNAYAFV